MTSTVMPIASAGTYTMTEVMSGLVTPRGLAFGPDGALYVAEAGSGGNGPSVVLGNGATASLGATSGLSRLLGGVQTRVLSGLPSVATPAGLDAGGLQDVAFDSAGQAYGLFSFGSDSMQRDVNLGSAGALLGTISQLSLGGGSPEVVADIAAYEFAANPAGGSIDSNPFGLTLTPSGNFIVADAGGNDLLHVTPADLVTTLAVLPARPNPLSFGPPVFQSVPTTVTVGPDGAYYVGQLTGFPFLPGAANIYRVDPLTNKITTAYAGFTNIVDLTFDADGNLLVLQVSSNGLASPMGPGTGLLIKVDSLTGDRTMIASEGLTFPVSVVAGPDGSLYVSNRTNVPTGGQVLRLTPVPEPATIAMLALGTVALVARRLRTTSIVLCLVCVISDAAPTQGAQYTVTQLGRLGTIGEASTVGLDINNSGQVVGESGSRAFLYDDGTMYDLGRGSRAHSINASGQVAGWSYFDGADPHAFLWTPTTSNGHTGTMQDLGTLGGSTSRAFGINDAGHVVGESITARGEVHGFLYDGEMHDLGSLGGYTAALAINNSGQIVGASIDDSFHATLWDADRTLYDLGGFSGTHVYASSINDRGEIVGHWDSEVESRSFYLAEPGYVWLTAEDIGSFGGTLTAARDINSNGAIVGTANTAVSVQYPFGVQHAFIYTTDNGLVDLNDLIDPQQLGRGPDGVADGLTWANAINDRGQIIAGGWNFYVLTPVPEPSGLEFILPTLVLLGYRRLRGSKPGTTADRSLSFVAA